MQKIENKLSAVQNYTCSNWQRHPKYDLFFNFGRCTSSRRM